YLISWEANKEQRAKARAREQERVAAARQQALKDTYDTMARRHAASYLETLSLEARAAIKAEAEERVIQKSGKGTGFNMIVAMEQRRIALQRHPIPSFEEWQRSQQ